MRKNLAEAVDHAVEQCIQRNGPLAGILRGHRAEVTDTMLKEYDEVFHIECEKEISREEGRAEERVNTERERRRAEVAEQKVEEAEQKAEIAEQKAEAAEQKAEIAEQKAEVAEQKAEEAKQKAKVFKLMMHGKTKEEIADITGIILEEVEQIMSEV